MVILMLTMLHILNNRNETTVISLCYRTGTGKLCHMQSSSEDTDPFEWDYEYDECKDSITSSHSERSDDVIHP